MNHLDEERLFQLALEQLDAETQAAAVAHLEHCEECRRRHASLSSIVFARTVAGDSGTHKGPNTKPDRSGPGGGPPLQRGAAMGRYVLLEKLGAGGMGEVFAAYDPQLDRRVALKLLRAGSLSAEEGKARLLREAQAMARLQHPNVIAVHDVGELGDRVFIAMEFVEGETIAEWLRAQRSWTEVVDLFLQAGAGLAAAHRAGLVHRDFKPDNVLLSADGRPRVLDFGLARQSTSTPASGAHAGDVPEGLGDSPLSKTLTRDGAVMGTPGYMAPEQLAGLPTDERSDQYSFCVALYEALYGRRPFGGATLKEHAREMASGYVPAPPNDSPVPRWVYEVLNRGLAPNPTLRFADMTELLAALTPRAERRGRANVLVAALLTLALSGVGYGLYVRQRLTVCGGQEEALRGAWDTETKSRLKQAFLDTRLPFAPETWGSVEKTLDTWALDWVGTAREVCEATKVRKVDTAELYGLRRACLDERLLQLRSLTTLFAMPDRQVVVNAATAARSLEGAATCGTHTPRDGRDDPQLRAAEGAMRTHLADARALFAAGKYALAISTLERALGAAAPDRVKAEVFLLLGRAKSKQADIKGSTAAHLAAAEHAVRDGDEGLEAMAFSRLAANHGYDEHDPDAETLLRLARAAASRVPAAWEVQTELARNEALVELGRQNTLGAKEQFERALVLQRAHLPPEHPDIATTLNNIGMALATLRQFDDAVRSLNQSLAIHEAVEGPRHPSTATAQHNLAVTLRTMGRLDDARALFDKALAVRREALGPTSVDTLSTMQALARTHIMLDKLEDAAALVAELRAVRETGPFPAKDQWSVLELEAEIALAGGYWREAAARATSMLELARQEKHEPMIIRSLLSLGRAKTGLGAWADARRALGEVESLFAHDEHARDERDAELASALGELELAQSHLPEARAHFEHALSLRQPGPASRAFVKAHLDLGRCAIEEHHTDEAVTRAREAEALLEPLQGVATERTRAKVLLAQAAWLAKPQENSAATDFSVALAALPEGERARLQQWARLKKLVPPDAGP